MQNRLFFKGIYGEDQIELIRNIIHIGTIETTSRENNWYIKPHIHNDLYQVFVIESGSMNLLYENGWLKVDSPSFIIIPPHAMHGFEVDPEVRGWVISLLDKTVENMLKLDADMIMKMDEIQVTKINTEDKLITDAHTTIHKCIYEYQNELPGKKYALQYLTGMLILRLYRIPKNTGMNYSPLTNSKKLYFRNFTKNIKQHHITKSIAEYAEELSISSTQLNRICKEVSGKTSKDILLDYVINEAKRLLYDYNKSVAEISYELTFENPSYFTRLFKKKTGLTPSQFRKKFNF